MKQFRDVKYLKIEQEDRLLIWGSSFIFQKQISLKFISVLFSDFYLSIRNVVRVSGYSVDYCIDGQIPPIMMHNWMQTVKILKKKKNIHKINLSVKFIGCICICILVHYIRTYLKKLAQDRSVNYTALETSKFQYTAESLQGVYYNESTIWKFYLFLNNDQFTSTVLGENESIFAEPCIWKLCSLSFWDKAIKGLVTYI
jgi:hypothetical protein